MLLEEIKVDRVLNRTAAGTATMTSSAVDTQNFEGVMFVAIFQTITDGTPAIQARQGQLANMSDGATLAGSLVSLAVSDDDKAAVLDIYRPEERYLDCQVVRGGVTGAAIDAILAVRYRGRTKPTVQDIASIAASKVLASPDEGTP